MIMATIAALSARGGGGAGRGLAEEGGGLLDEDAADRRLHRCELHEAEGDVGGGLLLENVDQRAIVYENPLAIRTIEK
jgi:hypothetical protein